MFVEKGREVLECSSRMDKLITYHCTLACAFREYKYDMFKLSYMISQAVPRALC
jgi:hypothetical protein